MAQNTKKINPETAHTIENIKEIEALTQEQAAAMAAETAEIKEHTVYFVDFGGYFGYSALVYADGMHIYHANDYALHHPNKSRDDLRDWYLSTLNNKLFTESELVAPTSSADEIKRRRYYLRDYYGMRRPYISCFQIFHNDAEKEAIEKKVSGLTLNPICYGYYSDSEFVKKCISLYKAIEAASKANADNFDYWKEAFLFEMINHEYAINWQADYDVISCFADVDSVKDYDNRDKLFDAARFSAAQRLAYAAAKAEYYKKHADF